MEKNKINFGSGRLKKLGYCNIDITQYVDHNGEKMVDIVLDVEKEKLPFDDNSIEDIIADNVFEHLGEGFIFALNECHRVLKAGSKLHGVVPLAGTRIDFMDITHKRHFNLDSFGYICGENLAMDNRPAHPKYADYGVLPWKK
jgi:predicted SAM-dependent methyltransferase